MFKCCILIVSFGFTNVVYNCKQCAGIAIISIQHTVKTEMEFLNKEKFLWHLFRVHVCMTKEKSRICRKFPSFAGIYLEHPIVFTK